MYEVWEINALDLLLTQRGVWDALLRRTPGATFFQTLDWLEVYWRHFGAEQRLRVLLVARKGETIGIAPLVVRREQTRVGQVRVLTYPLDYWGSCYGPIGPEPAVTLVEALRYLRGVRRDWQVLELRWVQAEHPHGDAAEQALRNANLPSYRTRMERTYLVDLEDATFAEYLASRTSKWRNNYRRWERRLAEAGEVTFLRHRPAGAPGDDDPRWDLYDVCESLAARSWQAAARDGVTLSSPAVRPFLRDLHAAASRVGSAEMNLFYVAGEPAAFAYNYAFQGRVFGLRMGYDARAAREGVGNVLLTRALEDSFRRGDKAYDLGPGSPQSKRCFYTRAADIYRYSVYAPFDVKAQLIRAKRWRDSLAASRGDNAERVAARAKT